MFLLHLHIITVQILLLVPGKLSHCSTCSIPVHLLLWVFCSKVFFSYSNIIFPHHTLQIEHGVLFCNTIFPTFTKFDRKENFDKGKKKKTKKQIDHNNHAILVLKSQLFKLVLYCLLHSELLDSI